MQVTGLPRSRRRIGRWPSSATAIRDFAIFAAPALVLTIGLLFLVRRLQGAFLQPLPAWLLIAGVACTASTIVVAALALRTSNAQPHWQVQLGLAMSSLGLLTGAFALAVPGSPQWARTFVWLVSLSAIAVVAVIERSVSHRPGRPAARSARSKSRVSVAVHDREGVLQGEEMASTAVVSNTTGRPTTPAETADSAAEQWLERIATAGGTLTVRGWLLASFEPEQRTAWAHVAFCPPLDESPRVECSVDDSERVRIKPGQVFPYGLRFELKRLDSPAEAATVRIQFSATSRESGES